MYGTVKAASSLTKIDHDDLWEAITECTCARVLVFSQLVLKTSLFVSVLLRPSAPFFEYFFTVICICFFPCVHE